MDALVFNVIRHTQNFATMRRFYEQDLEMPAIEEWEEPQNRGVVFSAGGIATLEILDLANLAEPDGRPVNLELSLQVESADWWHDHLQAKGVTIARGLEDAPWGHRSFGIDDPDGLRIWFYHKIPQLS
ncbi:MAG: VOC family protein [Chloroflexi bacterium]|nr:VOC family protein [Chloroflexota bacterium]